MWGSEDRPVVKLHNHQGHGSRDQPAADTSEFLTRSRFSSSNGMEAQKNSVWTANRPVVENSSDGREIGKSRHSE